MLVLSRHRDEEVQLKLSKDVMHKLICLHNILMAHNDKGGIEIIEELQQVLDQPINVCVVDIRSDKVRLGFAAVNEVEIMRTELLEGVNDAKIKNA